MTTCKPWHIVSYSAHTTESQNGWPAMREMKLLTWWWSSTFFGQEFRASGIPRPRFHTPCSSQNFSGDLFLLIRGNIGAQVVVGYQGETQSYWLLSYAKTTKVRRDSGELEPFILNTIHLIESPNRLPPSYLIGTGRQPNRQMCSTCEYAWSSDTVNNSYNTDNCNSIPTNYWSYN